MNQYFALGVATFLLSHSAIGQTQSARVAPDAPVFEKANAAAKGVYLPKVSIYPINDTGQTSSQCYQAVGNGLASCTSALSTAVNSNQDGMIGRDVTHSDSSDGRRGFSFTKLSVDGAVLQSSAPSWACTRDNVTGLVWENKTDDGGIHDKDNRYKVNGWTGDIAPFVSGTNAENLCGRSDWRLPTWFELNGLLDYGISSAPAIDTNWFVIAPPPSGAPLSSYWTATQSNDVAGSSAYRYCVNFTHAVSLATCAISGKIYARLVSGAGLASAGRFRISSDGTEVTDRVLGLTWRRCLEGASWSGVTCTGTPTGFMHHPALIHAQTQNGWRVPNIKEVMSIVDRGVNSPAWDTVLFPGTPQLNTSGAADYWLRRPTTSTVMPFDNNYIAMISIGRDLRDNSWLGRGVHYLRLVKDISQSQVRK